MKRSEVNAILQRSAEFFASFQFLLPPFGHWTPADWAAAGPEASEIARNQLGWDITDFGKGRFGEFGLTLFTLRNGRPENLRTGQGKVYAEKIMIVGEGQVTPWHHHRAKTEDIINRGGGRLALQLAWATEDGRGLADRDVEVSLDGVAHRLPGRGEVVLAPGQSITLPPYLYHTFTGAAGGGAVLTGEVSTVNDDHADNFFLEAVGRFPAIDEDAEPWRLLVGDYAHHYRHA